MMTSRVHRPMIALLAGSALIGASNRLAASRGDFWLDASQTFSVAASPTAAVDKHANTVVTSDYTRKSTGDCSVRVELTQENGASASILMTPGPYRESWALGGDWVLQFDLTQTGGAGGTLTFVDTAGRIGVSRPLSASAHEAWTRVDIPLAELDRPADFDFSQIARVAIDWNRSRPTRIWLDAVRFLKRDGSAELALTDRLTSQRMADEVATRPARIAEAMKAEAGRAGPSAPRRAVSKTDLTRCFGNLWLGIDIEETNRQLLAIYTSKDLREVAEYGLEYTWDLLATPMLCRLYFNFSRSSTRLPGRLTPDVEQAILETLWERTQYKNDIHAARQSTWAMTGSENHDLNAKIANVLSSQIFQREPEFSNRTYPNLGSGLGYGYWFHKTAATGRFHGPEGTSPRKDPEPLHPRDHFEVWTAFMKTYLRERVGRGFFVEKASPGYMRHSLSFLQDLYDFADDPELRTLTGMFLDLVWAEWAQEQIAGARGGAKTRDHGPLMDNQQHAMYQMATYLFGGPSRTSPPLTSFWLTDYRPPAVVWNLALNRESFGSYAYRSRTPGEEPAVAPRPSGMERTLWCETDSRLLRYSWVTPSFILGTQMDHPLAVHSHLSHAGRAHGLIFSTSARAMVFPRDVIVLPNGKWRMGADAFFRSVQQGPVLITQQSRGFTSVSPEWFPMTSNDSKPYGVYFSPGLGHVEEENGWVFVKEGNAYLAVRIASGVYQVSVDADSDNKEWLSYEATESLDEPLDPMPYRWNSDRTILLLKDRHSPIVLEAAQRNEFPTLAEFKRHIHGNALTLLKTTVPGWYRVSYTSRGHRYDFNASNNEVPTVDGRPINYAPSQTFDSPWLKADYRTGVVAINDGRTRLTLDFSKSTRRETPLPPEGTRASDAP